MRSANSWFNNLEELKEANREYFELEEKDGVVLAQDWGKKEPYSKRFRLFTNFEEAVLYVSDQVEGRLGIPALYEYIGVVNQTQKPYFDVDIPKEKLDDPYLVVDNLVSTLDLLLKDFQEEHELKACVYETVYFDKEDLVGPAEKHSFHVVVNGIRFANNLDMFAFGQKVKSAMNDEFSPYIDPIWTTYRQMRLLGSSKKGKFSAKSFFYARKLDGNSPVEKGDLFSKKNLRESMITEPKGAIISRIP